MSSRNRDLPPALPCGDDPLVRTCGIGEPSVLSSSSVNPGTNPGG